MKTGVFYNLGVSFHTLGIFKAIYLKEEFRLFYSKVYCIYDDCSKRRISVLVRRKAIYAPCRKFSNPFLTWFIINAQQKPLKMRNSFRRAEWFHFASVSKEPMILTVFLCVLGEVEPNLGNLFCMP